MRLLIVDDSSVIRSRIARIAQHPDLSPIEVVGLARHGEEAIGMCSRHRPDVVTMDLTMPNMDGLACIQGIVKISGMARILVVSALSDKRTALKALTYGAHGYIHKPFTDAELVAGLQELVKD
ncbi:MAG: response regulator transcription factor [Rhodocyclales bacterium]|nr:response regulator transcription factor [Rhodocyclales bacterium]